MFELVGLIVLYVGVILTVVSGVDYFLKNKTVLTKSM
jgi:phosphatidylglycerophosphate synthase